MARYVALRLLQAVGIFFAFMLVIFVATRASGDPTYLLLPLDTPQEQVDFVRKQIGLDKTYAEQFALFVKDIVTFNLGRSIATREPVADVLARRVPNTLKLSGVALGMVLVLAFPLGILASTRRGRPADGVIRLVAAVGQAVPPFWLGLMLMDIFAVSLRWLPVSGMGDWRTYVMPAITQGVLMMAGIIRLLRSAMLENLDSEFVKLARIKGVSEARIVWVHVLRNAVIPVLTFAGLFVGIFVGGSVVTETVFNWPGVGQLIYQAIARRDFPVVQGVVAVVAGTVILINLAVDLLYAVIDPRIRYA